MTDVKDILKKAIEIGASDVHINVGLPPVIRKNTELIDLDFPPVSKKDGTGNGRTRQIQKIRGQTRP
jgi:twitching motility protein PilT